MIPHRYVWNEKPYGVTLFSTDPLHHSVFESMKSKTHSKTQGSTDKGREYEKLNKYNKFSLWACIQIFFFYFVHTYSTFLNKH